MATQYPKPDRSKAKRSFQRNELGDLDIGWNEGEMSDGRPFVIESWSGEGHTWVTLFFSTIGIEDYSESDFRTLFERENLLTFRDDVNRSASTIIHDDSNNEIWSVTIAVAEDEGDTFLDDQVGIKHYRK